MTNEPHKIPCTRAFYGTVIKGSQLRSVVDNFYQCRPEYENQFSPA